MPADGRLTVIASGAVLDALWLLGIGVWAVITAMARCGGSEPADGVVDRVHGCASGSLGDMAVGRWSRGW
ncbi:hypothetical protein [Streptomyces sp. NBC_01408]|uniref:hypothetical protein n=1 Tax=Streptomyces sp. NBC_01408 TaxID=2903855 RepID=UPI002255BE42|nr:hypothetical protein [Streptomyces sp. NBC_01408]MCX4695838.1 hypothetical protein [Streptomyces sp. NBC_01408]